MERSDYLVDNLGRRKTNFHPISLHISWSLRLNRKAAGRWATLDDQLRRSARRRAWHHWSAWINISIVCPCLRLSCVHGSNKAPASRDMRTTRASVLLAHAFIRRRENRISIRFLWIFDFPFHPISALFAAVWVIHRLASVTFITPLPSRTRRRKTFCRLLGKGMINSFIY